MNVPMFIEVLQSQNNSEAQICRKIMAHLYRLNISPLPFASSIYEVVDVLHALKDKNIKPAIFVVNTFWAEEIMRDLDALVGDTPILLLNRRLTTVKLDVTDQSKNKQTLPLQDMDTRRIAICRYGAKTSWITAEQVAKALVQYANDGAFWHIEALSRISSADLGLIPRS